jgi:hypothetical protein
MKPASPSITPLLEHLSMALAQLRSASNCMNMTKTGVKLSSYMKCMQCSDCWSMSKCPATGKLAVPTLSPVMLLSFEKLDVLCCKSNPVEQLTIKNANALEQA